MKVLHLAPPSTRAGAFSAHSFIDEEILGLRDAGVRCYVLADGVGRAHESAGVTVVPVGDPSRHHPLRRLLSIVAEGPRRIPLAALCAPRQTAYALAREAVARDLVRSERIDIVHSHFGWPGGFGGAVAAAAAGVPLVASLRGMDVLVREEIGYGLRLDAAYGAALGRLLRTADRTLYATDFLRREGVAAGAPAERARIVRKGVDLDRFRPPADRRALRLSLGLAGPVILAVGTLGPRKGYHHLIDALAALAHLPWTLVLAGEGPHRDVLEARARQRGLGPRIVFAGWVPRDAIGAHFAAADIFVHTAVLEAAGNVILEAHAAGCATIACDSGGPAEYIVAGTTGEVVPPEDPVALGAALESLLIDSPRCARYGIAARALAEARYAYPRMIADLLSVYEDAVCAREISARGGASSGGPVRPAPIEACRRGAARR